MTDRDGSHGAGSPGGVSGWKTWRVSSTSAEHTQALGRLIGEGAQPGDVVCLHGGVGAGKTTFVQGIARGLGVDEPITSPTFTIVCEYAGRLPLYHVDVYRLGKRAAEEPLGLEEYLEGDGVTAVEWAEWLEPLLPEERLVVRIEAPGDETAGHDTSGLRRVLHFEARGARPAALLEEVVRRWSN
ncbi:MAG: tRNA (adenosine(37)-N6)-threonylcarbamoyltransferase complex ATPase subunit type 1 TsaE [Alicyclobacillaceae bacterium]|nr:tRNA (adenosine(37)-N6)-threonylcarbamoyltransferase complex ATPase subunit type 1 TsaE [Alicyclobacillaceae bacterium]